MEVEGADGDVGPLAVMMLGQGRPVSFWMTLRADMTDDAWLTDLARVLSRRLERWPLSAWRWRDGRGAYGW